MTTSRCHPNYKQGLPPSLRSVAFDNPCRTIAVDQDQPESLEVVQTARARGRAVQHNPNQNHGKRYHPHMPDTYRLNADDAERINPILRHFTADHLPDDLVSQPICDLAQHMAATIPRSAELTTGLRKLLEAKDALVRAAIETRTQD